MKAFVSIPRGVGEVFARCLTSLDIIPLSALPSAPFDRTLLNFTARDFVALINDFSHTPRSCDFLEIIAVVVSLIGLLRIYLSSIIFNFIAIAVNKQCRSRNFKQSLKLLRAFNDIVLVSFLPFSSSENCCAKVYCCKRWYSECFVMTLLN